MKICLQICCLKCTIAESSFGTIGPILKTSPKFISLNMKTGL